MVAPSGGAHHGCARVGRRCVCGRVNVGRSFLQTMPLLSSRPEPEFLALRDNQIAGATDAWLRAARLGGSCSR